MRPRILQLFAWLAFSPWSLALGAPGDVDPSFVYPRPPVLEPDSTNAIPLADGFLVIKSRAFESPGSNSTLEVTRIDEDGRVVTSFGSGGKVTIAMPGAVNVATAATLLSNGSILLGGFRREDRPDASGQRRDSVAAIARLDAEGRLDPAFGSAGVATFDIPGDLDRVGAVNVLPDGRLVAAVWSRTYFDPYDCAHDRVALVRLAVDGSAAETLMAWPSRDSFVNDWSCRTTLTMQVLPDQAIFYPYGYAILIGSELGIIACRNGGDCDDMVDANRRYGPFVVEQDSQAGVVFAFVGLTNAGPVFARGDPARPTFPGPAWQSGLPLGKIAGLTGGITAMQLAANSKNGWYLGFANDFGQAGIARFDRDGSLDKTWGGGDGVVPIVGSGKPGAKDGVLNVSYGLATDVRLISVRPGGNIVVATADGIIQRLIGPPTDLTHGGLVLGTPSGLALEGGVPVGLRVSRTGGTTGAVSVEYRVYEARTCDSQTGVGCPDTTRGIATAGQDFIATGGRLDWSEGDGTDREITVQILDDALSEPPEKFYVELESATGGAVILAGRTEVTIDESDRSPVPPSIVRVGESGGGSGGGGAIDWLLLVLLAAIALARAHANAPSARHTRTLLLASTLLAVAAPAAWSGIGDMDPSYGAGGRFEVRNHGGYFLLPPLADGRLLYRVDGGYRRTDASGRPDDSFGPGGVRAWPVGCFAQAWARTRGGRPLAAGQSPDDQSFGFTLCRFLSGGEPDPVFGQDGVSRVLSLPRGPGSGFWDVLQLSEQSDGQVLLLIGHKNSYYDDDYDRLQMIRALPDGTLDRSFGKDGAIELPDTSAGGFVLLADGRIRVGSNYVTESGQPTTGAPVESALPESTVHNWSVAAQLPGGADVLVAERVGPSEPYKLIMRRADGTVDMAFGGDGTGVATLRQLSSDDYVPGGINVSADQRYIYVLAWHVRVARSAVLRLFANGVKAGQPDVTFGAGGLLALPQTGYYFQRIQGLADGSAIVCGADYAFRLLPDATASPGFVGFGSLADQAMWYGWRESDGKAVLSVFRAAGKDGVLRVHYETPAVGDSDPGIRYALAGVDFEAVSGDLVWTDGDSSDKSITIPILKDSLDEGTEQIRVVLTSPSDGSWIISGVVNVALSDSSPTPTPTPSATPSLGSANGSSGGGGAVGSWLLALLSLVPAARRARRAPSEPPVVSFRNAA